MPAICISHIAAVQLFALRAMSFAVSVCAHTVNNAVSNFGSFVWVQFLPQQG